MSRLLARMLGQPGLVAAVRALDARALTRIIDRIGLEDAGELVALATTEQLTGLLDEDLWRSRRAGADESFDPERFVRWLEVMREAGDAVAADKLVELDRDLVALGLQRNLLVVATARLGRELGAGDADADLLDKALDASLVFELEDYHLIARRQDGWDAILALLVALDRDHHDYLLGLLEQLAHASAEQIDDGGGLYQVLTSDEMLEVDAAAAREDRRAGEGYVAPSSAAAFLKLARASALDRLAGEPTDALTAAYFRQLAPPRAAAAATAATPPPPEADELLAILQAEQVLPPAHAQLAAAPAIDDTPTDHRLRDALADLCARDPLRHARCLQELGYLANVLLAAHTVDGRPPRPAEAADLALSTCTRGLARLLAAAPGADATELLADHGPVKLFRAGWPP